MVDKLVQLGDGFWRKGESMTRYLNILLTLLSLCEEETIKVGSLVDGEECWIGNGVRGLIWGKIHL